MAQTIPGRGRRAATPNSSTDTANHDAQRVDDRPTDTHRVKETRRSFQTTEFFVMIAAIAAVVVVGYANSEDTLDMERIWSLVTIIASAYMVSRGIAKAGSRDAVVEVRN